MKLNFLTFKRGQKCGCFWTIFREIDFTKKNSTFDFISTLLTSLPKHALRKAKASINSPTIIIIVNTTANSKLFGFSRVFLSSECRHNVEWMEVYLAPGCMGSPVLKKCKHIHYKVIFFLIFWTYEKNDRNTYVVSISFQH